MSLDEKYRPRVYEDVLGQDSTVAILKEIVREGRGFRQSYVFAGQYGSGKTTQARILARALLCNNPNDGSPCDECSSCKTMLDNPSKHDDFVEVDAANHSKKEDIAKIVDDIQYGTFSGNQKVYIFDESHDLSKASQDALLLPLENTRPGSQDKMLVCIFCTTEPTKMRPAILSRCAPVFKIRVNSPEVIARRLKRICDQESIEANEEALKLIAEVSESHIRDCLKAIEAISSMGPLTLESVKEHLQVAHLDIFCDLLESLGEDRGAVINAASQILTKTSPANAYRKMAELSMFAYRVHCLGDAATLPSFWDRDRVTVSADKHREFLVRFAQVFSERPYLASGDMFLCDCASLDQERGGIVVQAQQVEVKIPSTRTPPQCEASLKALAPQAINKHSRTNDGSFSMGKKEEEPSGKIEAVVSGLGVFIDPKAQGTASNHVSPSSVSVSPLSPQEFQALLRRRIMELKEERRNGGSTRQYDMGGS